MCVFDLKQKKNRFNEKLADLTYISLHGSVWVKTASCFWFPWRDSYDFEIHHREEVSISGVSVKTYGAPSVAKSLFEKSRFEK